MAVAAFERHRSSGVVVRLAAMTIAAVGSIPVGAANGTTRDVGANDPPHPPALLSPSDGATLHRVGNAPFSISAVDPQGNPYTGTVVIRNAALDEVTRFPTSPAVSGGVSLGMLSEPLTAGAYTWTAVAEDVFGATSEPSTSRSFTVAPAPSVGGGAVIGSVEFAPPGIPPAVCEPSSSTWHMDSAAAVFNTVLVGFAGRITVGGTGSSGCESSRFGDGIVALAISGFGPAQSTISCSLDGSYMRVAAALVLNLSGECKINNHPVSRVTVVTSLSFVSTTVGGGVTTRTQKAAITGEFVVVPE